jgi:hypothetical protein
MAATTPVARKAPAKKRAAAPRRAVNTAAGDSVYDDPAREPVVLDPEREAPPADMFPIFAIGDKQYYAPIRPHARVEITYLYLCRHEGPDAANGYILEELVGTEGYVALMGYEGLTRDDLNRIFEALIDSIQKSSAMKGPKGGLTIN